MPTALTLAQAAGQSFDNLHIRWLANALKPTLAIFANAVLPTFPEESSASHPVSNWLSLILSLADPMPATNVPIEQLTTAAQYVYGLCWMASFLQSSGGISNAQAATLLGFYNTIIGF